MPQLQVVDLSEIKNTGPMAKFGSSFGNSVVDRLESNKEADAIKNLMSQYGDEGASLEGTMSQLFGNRDIKKADKSNIAKTLQAMEEKKIMKSKDFRIAQLLMEEDLGKLNYQEILQAGQKYGLNAKEMMPIADKMRMQTREGRLTKDSISKDYNNAMKDLKNELKSTIRNDDKEALKEQIKKLDEARKRDLKRHRGGDRDFILEINMSDEDGQEDMQADFIEESDGQASEEQIIEEAIKVLTKAFPPSKFKGKTKTHAPTGAKFISDGKQWQLV